MTNPITKREVIQIAIATVKLFSDLCSVVFGFGLIIHLFKPNVLLKERLQFRMCHPGPRHWHSTGTSSTFCDTISIFACSGVTAFPFSIRNGFPSIIVGQVHVAGYEYNDASVAIINDMKNIPRVLPLNAFGSRLFLPERCRWRFGAVRTMSVLYSVVSVVTI